MSLIPALLAVLLFLGAPTNGDFYWSEAPRNALNGVFLKDFLEAMPWRDPTGFAYDYYAQYPALTILFYPPLFYAISVPFYWLFGVSHNTALLVVLAHYVAYALGAWRLFRFFLSPLQSVAAASILVAAPEIAFWGRQVMLEVPAFAFLIWASVYFVAFRQTNRPALLYLATALLVLAIYTKISVAFMAIAWAVILLTENRAALLRDKHIWATALLATLALIPLVALTIKFGQVNVQSALNMPDAATSRASLSNWLWYLKRLPDQLGWPVLVISALGAAVIGARHLRLIHPTNETSLDLDPVFWILWGMVGYVFFSLIDLKEARHSIFVLPPIVMLACALLVQIKKLGCTRTANFLWIALPAAVVFQTVYFRPVWYVGGYAAAAEFIADHAPENSSILFSGTRDGSFIFNLRAREERPDLRVVRADKLLVRVAARRELGLEEKNVSEPELRDQINRLGVSYVVAQPGFWSDLDAMQKLERVLASDRFEVVATIPTPSNYNAPEKHLLIYRNTSPINAAKTGIEIDLPMIGRSIKSSE
ncbi:ArnT family glycosyltransferase [Thauera phenolivorans]|uniref:ArnT family glycosyltransferase n=1 Tax=Thauera phenolivorans TaxID=1792543 RepID=UPI0018E3939A|nr:glycosyltransferase family 39 protein [Thauera phenolivorans]